MYRRREPIPPRKPIRRKCSSCEKVKTVDYIYSIMPPTEYLANKNAKKPKRLNVKNAIHRFYCTECRKDNYLLGYKN